MFRFGLIALLLVGMLRGADLPLLGLAHVGVRVADVEKARAFYHGVLGLEEAFRAKVPDPTLFFKVNDHQFIKVTPGLAPGELVPMTHIAMYTDRIQDLRQMMMAAGLSPSSIKKSPQDGNLAFTLQNLPGQKLAFLEFVQYLPDSQTARALGKFLNPQAMGDHLQHAGINATDMAAARNFYVNTLGFKETWSRTNGGRVALIHLRMPGPSGDYVELSNQTGVADLSRERAGQAAHFSFEVPEVQFTYKQSLDRIKPEDRREAPRFGFDERWQCNLFDPDGTRVEFMQPRDKSKLTPVAPVVLP